MPGSIGQYTLKILIRNYFTTEIGQWMNVSTKLDFFSKCGEYQLAYTADKLAKVFIKHLFDGIDKKYESTDLVVNIDTLYAFKNKLNYAVMEEVKSLNLNDLIVTKLDSFEVGPHMNEIYELISTFKDETAETKLESKVDAKADARLPSLPDRIRRWLFNKQVESGGVQTVPSRVQVIPSAPPKSELEGSMDGTNEHANSNKPDEPVNEGEVESLSIRTIGEPDEARQVNITSIYS